MTTDQMTEENERYQYLGVIDMISCCRCGISFAVPTNWLASKKENGSEFFCPNGHGQTFGGGIKLIWEREKNEAVAKARRAAVDKRKAFRVAKEALRREQELRLAHNSAIPAKALPLPEAAEQARLAQEWIVSRGQDEEREDDGR